MENRKWYQPYCKKCPYLVFDEELEMVHCVRPVGESCLAEGLLVGGLIIAEAHNEAQRKSYEDNNGPTRIKTPDPVVNELTKKRRAKIHKRRR